MLNEKHPEQVICEFCNHLFIQEDYKLDKTTPEKNLKITCPVCESGNSIEGSLVLEGEFLRIHREGIINLINTTAKSEAQKYPLERIIQIKNTGNRLQIITTYEHLARRLGEVIHKMYKGELIYNYFEDKYIRGHWKKDY